MPISQWGIECGDGWYGAIDDLCAKLQVGADKGEFKQPVVAQVKQKIGKMQFYLVEEGPQYDSLIYEAAYRAYLSCEICGERRAQRGDDLADYCETHQAARDADA